MVDKSKAREIIVDKMTDSFGSILADDEIEEVADGIIEQLDEEGAFDSAPADE